jgi:hypothetical protein
MCLLVPKKIGLVIDGKLCLETAAGFVKVVLVLLHRTSCRIWKSYVLRSSLDSRRCLHCSLAKGETIEEAAFAHGVDIEVMLKALNEAANSAE